MMKLQGMMIITSMCGIILLFMAIKAKSHLLLNLVFRGLVSALIIIGGNFVFDYLHIPVQIGLNPITLLTGTILGFPGLALVFGINFYGLL